MKNTIGERGEWIFSLAITEHVEQANGPLFMPAFLGDKWPLLDFYVEVLGAKKCFFFVQVKSTRQGYGADGSLKIQVKESDMRGLSAFPAPTYVVGIDESSQNCYLLSASEHKGALNKMPTKFKLNAQNLFLLKEEVVNFWTNLLKKENFRSRFVV